MDELSQEYAEILTSHLKQSGEQYLLMANSLGKKCSLKGISMSEIIDVHFESLDKIGVPLNEKLLESQEFLLEVAMAMSLSSGTKTIETVLTALYDQTIKKFKELRDAKTKLQDYAVNLENMVRVKLYELKESEEKYRALVQTIPDIIYRIDPEGKFIFLNSAVNELGYQSGDLLGRHFSAIIPPSEVESISRSAMLPRYVGTMTGDRNAPKLFDERRTGERKTTGLKVNLLVRQGFAGDIKRDEYIGEVSSSGMYKSDFYPGGNGKEFIGTVGVIRDITERTKTEEELKAYRYQLEEMVIKRTKELSKANELLEIEISKRRRMEEEILKVQKLESIGILAGGIAHDFNNLLTGILGNVGLAKIYVRPGDKMFNKLDSAEKAALRATDLTQQLLTFSKGGLPVKKTIRLAGLLNNSASLVLSGSNVKCKLSVSDDLWLVDADEGQFSQVLNNLLINAMQAMPEGGKITVEAENIEMSDNYSFTHKLPLNEGKYVKISIRDQGIGIPPENLSKIFDPYFTTKEKGSGLGLAITYSIIKNHNGYIAAESETGVGTAFHIYLPAAEIQDIAIEKKCEGFISGKGKILLMDDEDLVRKAAGEILSFIGYDVTFAIDGSDTIRLYQEALVSGQPFDAVILDLTVPGAMGGKEAIQNLIKIDPKVKAIVSSGYSNDQVMANYREFGFRSVIAKPYKCEALSKILHDVITGL